MQRLLAVLFALGALVCAALSLSYFGRSSGPGELRLYGLAFMFVAGALGFTALALFAAPMNFRRTVSFGSLGTTALFLTVAVVLKACMR